MAKGEGLGGIHGNWGELVVVHLLGYNYRRMVDFIHL